MGVGGGGGRGVLGGSRGVLGVGGSFKGGLGASRVGFRGIFGGAWGVGWFRDILGGPMESLEPYGGAWEVYWGLREGFGGWSRVCGGCGGVQES